MCYEINFFSILALFVLLPAFKGSEAHKKDVSSSKLDSGQLMDGFWR